MLGARRMIVQTGGELRWFARMSIITATILVWAFFFASPVAAIETAQRQGSDIIFRQNTFVAVSASTDDLKARGLPEGTKIYEYSPSETERQIIAFAKGVDPLTAEEATFVVYNYGPPAYTMQGEAQAIAVTGSGTATESSGAAAGDNQVSQNQDTSNSNNVSCSGTALGSVGWIVCPVSNFMAWITDKLYEQIVQYLTVQPIQSNSEGSLYRFWSIMRDLANVAFIIVSLIVIYSQITGAGISNYGLKKTFPRLVVTIVVVNISFWICALMIDLSNFFGHQLQQLFIDIAKTVNGEDFNTLNSITWTNFTSSLLTGSASAVGAAVGVTVLVGATDGALAMVIPILIGVLLSVIVALIILAARQALITVLVIISPLAFLSYVLPSTEKLFDKWKDIFFTMIIMFPLMSLLFGGSRLAGVAILTNGRDANNINLIILGLAVQVAPLVMTPLIVKFSGSLLGRLGAVMNDPQRGIIDRSRVWARERADLRKAQVLAGDAQKSWLGDTARRRALKKRTIQQRTEAYNKRFEAMADASTEGRQRDKYNRYTDLRNKEVAAHNERTWNAQVLHDDELLGRTMNTLLTDDEAKNARNKTDAIYNELKLNGDTLPDGLSRSMGRRAYAAAETGVLTEVRTAMAEREVRAKIDRELLADGVVTDSDGAVLRDGDGVALRRRTIDGKTLQDYAAGVGHKNLMVASQTARVRKEFGEHVAAEDQLMRHFKLNSSQWQQMAASGDAVVTLTDASGNQHSFRADNEYVKEAAIEHQFKAGSAGQKREIIRETGREIEYVADDGTIKVRQGYNYEARATVSSAAVASGIGGLVPFVNDLTFDTILRGEYNGVAAEKMHSLRQVFEGRLKAENFAGANDGAIELIYSIPSLPDYQQIKASYLQTLSPERRSEIEATFDEVYAKRHMQLRHDAYRILNTPELRRNTNAVSRDVYERYAVQPTSPEK